MKKEIKALLADFDGTLVDSESIHIRSWEIFAESQGIKGVDFHPFIGTSDSYVAQCLIKEQGLDKGENEIVRGKMDIFAERIESELKAFPGVLPTLEKLEDKGVAVVVVTSSRREYLNHALDLTGIGRFAHAYVCFEDVADKKPHPEPYVKAYAMTGYEPEECAVIEDSIAGVQSAKEAGLFTMAVTTSYSEEQLNEADAVLSGFANLLDYIEI